MRVQVAPMGPSSVPEPQTPSPSSDSPDDGCTTPLPSPRSALSAMCTMGMFGDENSNVPSETDADRSEPVVKESAATEAFSTKGAADEAVANEVPASEAATTEDTVSAPSARSVVLNAVPRKRARAVALSHLLNQRSAWIYSREQRNRALHRYRKQLLEWSLARANGKYSPTILTLLFNLNRTKRRLHLLPPSVWCPPQLLLQNG